jgi:CAAX prenyl protease-like protein
MKLPLNRNALVRILPFALFMVLLAVRGALPEDGSWGGIDPRWVYGITVFAVGLVLAFCWREYGELARQTLPTKGELFRAVLVGFAVFLMWTRLDAPWMTLGEPAAVFVPMTPSGELDWALIAVRIAGAALLVPVMEELFWRSFLMRWIAHPQFETVVPRRVGLKAIVLSTFCFMLAHTLWLAAIFAGLAYAWLYVRTGKLWVPVIAHAVTNGALAVWVVQTGNWSFW